MNNLYIINDIVEFNPISATLRNLRDTTKVAVIHSPASRCFLFLIENKNKIVTRDEIYHEVWKSRGFEVSDNTYYQNISILRKGLKKSGIESDVIVTIPRVGLTISRDSTIVVPPSKPKDDTPNKIFPEITANDTNDEEHSVDNKFKVRLICLTQRVGIAVFSLLMFPWLIDFPPRKKESFFDGYHLALTEGACHFYVNDNIETSTALKTIVGVKQDCQDYPWVYITKYKYSPRVSVISCDAEFREKNMCISDYLMSVAL